MLVEERACVFHIPMRPDIKINAALVCVLLDRLQSAQKRFLFSLLCGAAPAELRARHDDIELWHVNLYRSFAAVRVLYHGFGPVRHVGRILEQVPVRVSALVV